MYWGAHCWATSVEANKSRRAILYSDWFWIGEILSGADVKTWGVNLGLVYTKIVKHLGTLTTLVRVRISTQALCLGPMSRTLLNVPSQGQGCSLCTIARPCSPIIRSCTVHTRHHTTCMWAAIKIPAEPKHAFTFICTLRHGGSTEPALPMAELRPVREKEKRKSQGIHLCSQLNQCPGKG